MTAFNADIPTEMMERIRLAKLLMKSSMKEIAAEAFEAWLREKGITSDKMPKIKGQKT